MAKPMQLITVKCPCCEAELHIDPETKAVIRFVEHVKPRTLADLETGLEQLKGAAARRENSFQKSVESQKTHHDVLNKKFDEMLRIAKENPDEPPPKRDFDFD